jgi:hypothetical protein
MCIKQKPHRRGAKLYSVPNEIAAAARARWLAELCTLLEEALGLLPEFILIGDLRSESLSVYARIEALRSEVMRLRHCPSEVQTGPEWMLFERDRAMDDSR